jgi:hypothetical protein
VLKLTGLSQGCFSLDFASKQNIFAFSTPHHGIYLYDYQQEK